MVNKKSDKAETKSEESVEKPKKKGRIFGDPVVILNE